MKTINVLKYVGFGILGIGFVILAIFVTMSLWNWLIPQLFHGPALTFWQAAGLFLLSKILLTGIAPGRQDNHRKKDWRNKCREKYHQDRSDEEKVVTPE